MASTQTLAEEQQAEWIAGFDEGAFGAAMEQGEPDLIRGKREEAFGVYKTLPAPTARTEEWRRTDPRWFPFGDFAALPLLPRAGQGPAGEWDEHFDAVIAVTDEGFSVSDPNGALAEAGIDVLGLAEAADRHPELVAQHLQKAALPPETGKFEALNAAFWNFGLFLYVPDGVELEKGILLRHDHRKPNAALLSRALMVVGERARVSVAELYRSPDDVAMLAVTGREMVVGRESRLQITTLREWGRNTYHIANDMGKVERDAQIDLITLNFGSKISKMKFGSDVAGQGAAAELDGIFFGDDKQHFDQTSLQVHSAPDTYSRLLYKGTVRDTARSVYQGVIQAKRGAIRVDAYQTNNNIVLSEGARADTIPGLLIDADDLKCSHGATIGNLDEEQLFYLRSRGMPEAEARRVVLLGFFQEIIDRVPYGFIQDWVHDRITEKLANLNLANA